MGYYRMRYTSDGGFVQVNDLLTETLDEIAKACKNGCTDQLETILNSLLSDQLSDYLNAMINSYIPDDSNALYLTPLMIASVHGHDSIVDFLLKNYSDHSIVDAINYSSDYDYDFEVYNEHFNKQTALWLAVRCKHLNVVQILISLGKANVNHRADYSSSDRELTPLALACINGQFEMVKYLIENGADLYNVDIDQSTSLMIASAYGSYHLIDYLLSLDYDLLNARNNNGSTALHEATHRERYHSIGAHMSLLSRTDQIVDRTFDIVKLLLEEHQAKLVKDNDGFTPLTRAAIGEKKELVEYFIQSFYTIPQVIDEFELIGSYLIVKRWRYEKTKEAYYYLLWAMKLRYQNSEALILKNNLLPPMEAYAHCTECQTIQGLKSIKANSHRLTMEGLLIWERQGVTSVFLSSLEYRAEAYHSYGDYQRALQLYLHGYDVRMKTQIDLNQCISDLEKCTDMMNSIISSNQTEKIQFDFFLKIFKSTAKEFLRNRNLPPIPRVTPKYAWSSNESHYTERYAADTCLGIILNLIDIGIKISSCCGQKQQGRRRRILRQHIEQLIQLDYRTVINKKTLLHLSLMEYHIYANISPFMRFPSLSLVKFLLDCRAPINAKDLNHNTPLHTLAMNTYQRWRFDNPYHFTGGDFVDYTDEEMNVVEEIFKLLLDAGAHLDAVGQDGTPVDCASHEKLQDLLRKYPIKLNLKCICARIIKRSNLNYTNCIHERLQSFVQMH